MPNHAPPSLYLPLALCALLALGACLDNTGPMPDAAGAKDRKTHDVTTSGPLADEGRPIPGMFGPGFPSLPIRDRYDSSLKAFRMLKARHGDSYAYTTGYSLWTGFFDSTRVLWSEGKPASRDVWYFVWDPPPQVPPGGLITLEARFRQEWFHEEKDIGANPLGAPAVSLDSLYALCLAHLPDTLGGMNWFELDSNYILSRCGSYEGMCIDECPPQVALKRVEWPTLFGPVDIATPECIMMPPPAAAGR